MSNYPSKRGGEEDTQNNIPDWNAGRIGFDEVPLRQPIDVRNITTSGIFLETNFDAEEKISRKEKVLPIQRVLSSFGSINTDSAFGLSIPSLNPILDGSVLNSGVIPLTPFADLEPHFHSITEHDEIKKFILKVGNGKSPPMFARVWVNYETWIEGQDEPIFVTSSPFVFNFFQSDVMTWFDIGISSMEQFEVSYFLVSPEMSFKHGVVNIIPADSVLLYKISLVRFIEAGLPSITKLPSEELGAFEFREIITALEELKKTAGIHIESENWKAANDSYRRAYYFLGRYFTMDVEYRQQIYIHNFNLHNNMALCSIKLEMYDRAIFHCNKALQLPDVAHLNLGKLYYRRAWAEYETCDHEAAFESVKMASKYTKNNTEVVELRQRIESKIKEGNKIQKELYKKMGTISLTK